LDTSDFANASVAPVFKPAGALSVPWTEPLGALGNTHSAVALPGTNDIVEGDELYVTAGSCPFGWMHLLSLGNTTTPPSQLSEFKLPENDASRCANGLTTDRNSAGEPLDGTFTMHNQTVTSRYVITSWYGGGLRVIDVADPTSPHEVAFFVPKPVPSILSTPDTPAPVYGKTSQETDDWWVATWSYPIIRNGLIYVSDVRNGLYILRATPGSDLAQNLARYRFLEGNSNLGYFLPQRGTSSAGAVSAAPVSVMGKRLASTGLASNSLLATILVVLAIALAGALIRGRVKRNV
jgi:hypothetical protein